MGSDALTKKCIDCKKEKSIAEFYPTQTGRYPDRKYTTSYCKPCSIKRASDYKKVFGGKGHVGSTLRNARHRAKRLGVPFALVMGDLPPIPEYCPVLGLKLEMGTGTCGNSSPSLDRLTPELGYIPGNVVWVSLQANQIKSNATPDQLRRVADFYSNLKISEGDMLVQSLAK